MSRVASKKSKSATTNNNITVVKRMRDYSKDPYFIKKHEEAKAFIKKYGLPERGKKRK